MDMHMDMGMDMPHDAAAGNSSSMDMGMGMDMADMRMVFFASTKTPLFSSSWAPTTTGQYVGTCIFLIALAVIQFGLIILKSNLDATIWSSRSCCSPLGKGSSEEGGEGAQVLQRVRASRPWRVGIDCPRAVLIVAIGGLGYLLMIAVMTMNIGYFMSVLGGLFLGAFVLGRFDGVVDY